MSTHCIVGRTKTAVPGPIRFVRMVSDAARIANRYNFQVPEGFLGIRLPWGIAAVHISGLTRLRMSPNSR